MQDLEIIKEFLRNKDSYLKCGNTRIQDALAKKFKGEHFEIDAIKKAKKEVKKEFQNLNNPPVVEIKTPEVSPEFLAQFNEMAKKLGMTGFQAPVSEEDELESILQRKKALRAFNTPDVKDQAGMHILIGCNHVPFHHVQLHRRIVELIKDQKDIIKGFHLMGDFLDLNPLSSHDRGRFTAVPGLTLNDEYFVGNELLDDFDRALPKNTWKTYLYGNHEDRYNRWMSVMDNAKTPLISPEDGLKLWQRGYNVKTKWSQDFITIGSDFDIFHGIYFNIHNAKKHLDTFSRNCAYVHTHRVQSYREGILSAHNIGTCANLKSKAFNYATRAMKNSWSNGFAINMVDERGNSHITQIVPDENGHFYFGGKRY